jgi:hypothetical protein
MQPQSQFALALVMSCCCVSFGGETNNCAIPAVRFYQPSAQLRPNPRLERLQPDSTVSGSTVSSAPVSSAQSENTLSDWGLHSRIFRSDRFYLTQRADVSAESGLLGFVHAVFTPEVVQIGKVSVTSPILTIARKKNPLCLLSAFGTDQGLLTFNLLELSW